MKQVVALLVKSLTLLLAVLTSKNDQIFSPVGIIISFPRFSFLEYFPEHQHNKVIRNYVNQQQDVMSQPNKPSHFFAHLARMKLIIRWPLMRSVFNENISEHSLQVAFVSHALALIENKKFNGSYEPERVALLAMFHDCSEVLTGDLPTPIKYFNPAIADEYKKIERIAEAKLVDMLPEEFRDDYRPLIDSDAINADDYRLVKQADSICAYLKCLEELAAGNLEFTQAKKRLETTMKERSSQATEYFMATFAGSFSLTLDEITDE